MPTSEAPDPRVCPICHEPLGESAACYVCILRMAVADAHHSHSNPADSISTQPGIPGTAIPSTSDFGDYLLHERLGEGAMGLVYRATKRSLKKSVAIKFIKSGQAASRRDRILFLREAELASRLDHPNIVNVSEVGENEGTPFLVMRYIDGRPLSERLLESAFCATTHDRILLLIRIARAVHYAHQRGVIHRDLKPGNILVDADGIPYVTDFGLARLASHSSTVTFSDGQAIGTPAFMAPEQAKGKRSEVTTSADIWSLGVILYQLVSGRLPFDADSMPGVVQCILDDDPPPLFQAYRPDPHSRTQVLPPNDLEQLAAPSRRDLQSICSRCLEKEPSTRYPTVAAFAEDLERWAIGQPVEARPVSGAERLFRWLRRHPAAAAALAATGIAILAVAWSFWEREATHRTEELRRVFNYVADMNLAQRGLAESNSVLFARALDDTAPSPGFSDLRGIEWGLLQTLHQAVTEPVWFRTREPLLRVVGSPTDGRVAVLGTSNLFLLDTTGTLLQRWPLQGKSSEGALVFAPDGQSLAVSSPTGTEFISLPSGQRKLLIPNHAHHLVFAPNGRSFAAAIDGPPPSGALLAWFDLDSRPLYPPIPAQVASLCWADDGSVRFSNGRAQVREWRPDRPDPIVLSPESYYSPHLRLSRSGKWLLRTSNFGVVHVLRLPSAKPFYNLPAIPGDSVRSAFSADESSVAFTSVNGAIHVIRWGPSEIPEEASHRLFAPGHSAVITDVAYVDSDRAIVSSSLDGTLRRFAFDAPARDPHVTIDHHLIGAAGMPPTFRTDSKRVALVDRRSYDTNPTNGASILWDLERRTVLGSVPAEIIAWSADDLALSWSRDGQLQVWKLTEPSKPALEASFRLNPDHHSKLESQLADNGRLVVSVNRIGVAEAFDIDSTSRLRLDPALLKVPGQTNHPEVDFVAASPHSPFAALAIIDTRTILWDIRKNRVIPLMERIPADIRFSSAGKYVAVTDYEEHRLRLFDAQTGAPLKGLSGHLGPVMSVDFTPDARQLVTGGKDSVLVVWNLATGREVFRHRLNAPIYWLRISPDARWLITGHLPTRFGSTYGSLGPGHYAAWPIPRPTIDSGSPTPISPTELPFWSRFRQLAREFPP